MSSSWNSERTIGAGAAVAVAHQALAASARGSSRQLLERSKTAVRMASGVCPVMQAAPCSASGEVRSRQEGSASCLGAACFASGRPVLEFIERSRALAGVKVRSGCNVWQAVSTAAVGRGSAARRCTASRRRKAAGRRPSRPAGSFGHAASPDASEPRARAMTAAAGPRAWPPGCRRSGRPRPATTSCRKTISSFHSVTSMVTLARCRQACRERGQLVIVRGEKRPAAVHARADIPRVAQAMERPSKVAVPRPISSRMTSERRVA